MINEYKENEKKFISDINEIMDNTYYVNWLYEFSKCRDNFFSDQWIYNSNILRDLDKENINKLELFYRGIDKYAKSKNIEPVFINNSNFYTIKLNNFIFEVGMLVGQGTVFFFNKEVKNNEFGYISFEDIINERNNKKSNGKILKKNLN